ncbi:dTDP-glucose 4,6-dehydratase [Planctomycetes bacterium K23_9]|uniref:dTDP-glucose 4,6-dehydratase n=1 Tax=Stieleria marina TaxID=1930275 RepID=A0A517NSM7_9BACT|nr:dTDP-glucose 4,6-dehydratase 2 [Planctomycetes bacterium K23_9]
MKLLVTGGCGFIGTNLIRRLLQSDHYEIINLDALTYAANPNSLHMEATLSAEALNRYQLVRGDIAEKQFVTEAFRTHSPDGVIHLAAESHVDRSIDGPAQFVQTNVVGTFNLLEATREHLRSLSPADASAFRFLHVSTDEVYGSLGETGLFAETTAYDPHSPYSATKAASDHLARAWHTTYGVPVIVTNCSNNYGPYQFPEKLLPLMIIKCIAGESLPVYGTGQNVRDWLHVQDHVDALLRVLSAGVAGETYNIGGDCQLSNLELVQRVCGIMDEIYPSASGESHSSRIEFVTDRPGHDFRYAIDASKIKRDLHWQPQHSIETGLKNAVRWYVENEPWWKAILDDTYQLQRLGETASGDQS